MEQQRGAPWQSWRTDEEVRIEGIRAICTAPDGVRLVVVKVTTNVDGLYGLGCATFAQRPAAVAVAVEDYLAPLLVGRNPDDIQDIWSAAHQSSYWRGGPVLNNALSGVDQALWDILGKRAGLPVFQLLGGRVREAADVYVHTNGADLSALTDNVTAALESGHRFVRCQVSVPGNATYGSGGAGDPRHPQPAYRLASQQQRWEPGPYVRMVPRMFEHLRSEFGDGVEILHDVHERIPPPAAVQLARDLEPYHPYFLEDPLAPEDVGHLPRLREQSAVPIALGELFTSTEQAASVVSRRLIDFLRVHLSDVGGFTPAVKLATLCELSGVRTAWHGPPDLSPVGQAANVHLDVASAAFGVQEFSPFSDRVRETFPGALEVNAGRIGPGDRPGWGVDLDEVCAAKYPFPEHSLNGGWPEIRRADGAVIRP